MRILVKAGACSSPLDYLWCRTVAAAVTAHNAEVTLVDLCARRLRRLGWPPRQLLQTANATPDPIISRS